MRNPFEAPARPPAAASATSSATNSAAAGGFFADFGGVYALNAVVGFLFACTGPVAIILTTGARGGLSESDISSWIFGAFFLNGFL